MQVKSIYLAGILNLIIFALSLYVSYIYTQQFLQIHDIIEYIKASFIAILSFLCYFIFIYSFSNTKFFRDYGKLTGVIYSMIATLMPLSLGIVVFLSGLYILLQKYD